MVAVVTFIFTTSYGMLSVLLYLATDFIIIRNRKLFDSSFFKLYTYDSILNVLLYFVNFFSMRLSTLACSGCALAPFFLGLENNIFLGFVIGMRYHMAYVQYTVISIISVNRLSVLLKYNYFEPLWKKYSWILIIVVSILPFVNTHVIFDYTTRFKYQADEDVYAMITSMPIWDIYAFLIPFMIFTIIVSLVANITSIVIVRASSTHNKSRAEFNFLIIMAITCFIQLVGTVISVALLHFQMTPSLNTVLKLALPYVSESLTLVQPWLLVIFSHAIKEKLKGMLGFGKKTAVVFKSRSLTT